MGLICKECGSASGVHDASCSKQPKAGDLATNGFARNGATPRQYLINFLMKIDNGEISMSSYEMRADRIINILNCEF